jgi:hypothetical protein
MAITTRQTNLLVNQDWKTVYQSFKEADFQSYDFETLRKSMIDYLRTYYPEDFNDFTESSEYVALIDLIAFLGQSLAFRADLNARENFFDTAERRDSILKLARLISYNAKRNTPASGLLKIDSVSTTENVTDSNGLNLSNLIINWNDTTNTDWREQFTSVLNAALINNQVVGNPGNSQSIGGIQTDEYSVNLVQGIIPTYSFTSAVEGNVTDFDAVSATTIDEDYIYEANPNVSGRFNVLYRSDNLGNASNNTGYFVYFKQGTLGFVDFNLSQSLPNRVVSTNVDNINNTDTWLYEISPTGVATRWTQVPAVAGVNVIYNNSTDRNLFQVNTRSNDQIDLVFGDGSFSNKPQGNFRLYYRVSNGQRYKITPDEMQGVVIPLTYVSRNNRVETITIRASLQYTVANADIREVSDDIRVKAPQQYYTQNRMITGEDYNLLPYTTFNSILKVKAVNRSSSGTSRFLDVLDTTGKYSSTNIFCSDGWLYREEKIESLNFSFNTLNDVYNVLYNVITPVLASTEILQFYYSKFRDTPITTPSTTTWYPTASNTGTSLGYFVVSSTVQDIGRLANNNLKYIVPGSLIKFSAGSGNYFNAQNVITAGTPTYAGDREYVYAAIVSTDAGNIVRLNTDLPVAAVVEEIIPVFKTSITDTALRDQIVQLIQSYKNFGLRYDLTTQLWKVILPADLDVTSDFSLTNTGDATGAGLDSSWLLSFAYNGASYNFAYRSLAYVFESLAETRFHYDPRSKVYDSRTGLTVRDNIKVLKINPGPNGTGSLVQDRTWFIDKSAIDSDGYENTTKVYITFTDSDSDGIPDDPDLFDVIVDPTTDPESKYVYFEVVTDTNNFISYIPLENTLVVSDYATLALINTNKTKYLNGQIFYATTDEKFYILNHSNIATPLTESTDYIARVGRSSLYFQYRHNSPNDRRIDPSPNNIMDLYILTKQYSADYLSWIQDSSNSVTEPTLPNSEELKLTYGSGSTSLEKLKALSDTIVYNSGKFKPIFGLDTNKVPLELQAIFKVVKNPNVNVSDNDIKTSIIAAINTYFDTANWDFGETFYFSELSTYLHNTLAPNIASIIIVPSSTSIAFGGLMQINANPDEVIVSAATVDNVQIISAITAAQLNQTLAGLNG